MKERPKTGAFLLIIVALLCVYLVKTHYTTRRAALSTAPGVPVNINSAGARLVYGLKVDINSATAAELKLLPGIGPVLAERIVGQRRLSGDFNSINELTRVKGLSPRRLKSLSPYITAGG